MWALLALPSDLELMVVPGFSPVKGILVDVAQEEVMEEPDVSSIVDVKSFRSFQVSKEVLPLFSKPLCNIIPDPLNPAIMDTSISRNVVRAIQKLGIDKPSPNV